MFRENILKIVVCFSVISGIVAVLYGDPVQNALHQAPIADENVAALLQEGLEEFEASDAETSFYQWVKSKIKRRHAILAAAAAVVAGVAIELKWHPCSKTYQFAKNYLSSQRVDVPQNQVQHQDIILNEVNMQQNANGGEDEDDLLIGGYPMGMNGVDHLREMLPEEEQAAFEQAYLALTPEYQRFMQGQLSVVGMGHHLRDLFINHYQQNHDVEQTMNWFIVSGQLGSIDDFRNFEQLFPERNN